MNKQRKYIKNNLYKLFHDAGNMTVRGKLCNDFEVWLYGFSYKTHPQISINDNERTFEVKLSLLTKDIIDVVGRIPSSTLENIKQNVNKWFCKQPLPITSKTNMDWCVFSWNGSNEHNLIEDYKEDYKPITSEYTCKQDKFIKKNLNRLFNNAINFKVNESITGWIYGFYGKCHPQISFTDDSRAYEVKVSLMDGTILDVIGNFSKRKETKLVNEITLWLKDNLNTCILAWNKINKDSDIYTYQDETDPHLR